MKKNQIGHRKPLVQDLLLVEGIGRAGKFLLANILNGFEGIEPVQYYSFLEYLPVMTSLGLVERKTAQELLRSEIDIHCYEMLIGRNLNHRKSDKSSIYNALNCEKYLKRSLGPSGLEVVKDFYRQKRYSFFILHEVMPHIKLFFETFKKIKIISIERSPVELVYSWFERGYASRFAADPTFFFNSIFHTQRPSSLVRASLEKTFSVTSANGSYYHECGHAF